jgi:glycosyltransferase involved in cell wall biosynthesis
VTASAGHGAAASTPAGSGTTPADGTREVRVLEIRSTSGQGGGPERALLLAASSARAHGVEETLCFLRRRGEDELLVHRRALELGASSHLVEERRAIEPRTLARIRRLLRERRIEIVHGHDYKADLLAFLLARLEPVVAVATAHGWPERTRRERWLYYPADRRILAGFAHVFAVSAELRDRLVAAGARPGSVEVLPNAVDVEAFRPDQAARARVRRAWGVGEHERVIGSLGRLDPEKRLDLLLDAFTTVAATRPEARLVVAGTGSRGAWLEEEARRRGLGARCLVLGHRADAEDVHRGFDVFVQASDTEGSPYSLLEAMASGTPVVATAVGDAPSLLQGGVQGLLTPPGDAGALARAILATLDHPEDARRRAAVARMRVCAERSVSARQERVVERYRRLLEERRGVTAPSSPPQRAGS